MFKFKFDSRIKNGYYSASYFNKACQIVSKYKPNEIVCMQFIQFSKSPIKVCGIEESVQLLQQFLDKNELKKIQIYGLEDGDIVTYKKPVLLIIGPYQYFGKYENVIDGILARRSSVCNNCYQMLKLIKPSQLIYMADRTDDYSLQPFDGYAAYVGGVRTFVTHASIEIIKQINKQVRVIGSIPHALIQEFDGNLNEAMKAYINFYGYKNSIALVDYHNDVIGEIRKLSKEFSKLFAIRIDTSSNMLDKSLQSKYRNDKTVYGVSYQLVKLARKALDDCNLKQTKIIVSSGIDNAKITNFQKHHTPIDYYGVGSNLITRNIHFTADLVLKNGHHEAKLGRKLFMNINRIKSLKRYI